MFKIYSVDDGRNVPIEYLPVSAITPKMGLALTQTGGQLAVASGTTAPSYICMCEREEACTAGDIIPVLRVGHDIIWETTAQVDMTSVSLGNKVTVHTDGLHVTATTTGGVAEVVYKDGDTAGSMVRVRF